MKRSRLKKVGKVGKANIEARKRIAEIAEEKGLTYCEIKFDGCLRNAFLAPAHRHTRGWYKGNVELLSDFKEWLVACQHCHSILDGRGTTTQEESNRIFDIIRS